MMRVAVHDYPKKFRRSTTSLMRTGKPQTFKLVFLENVILHQLLLFRHLRQYSSNSLLKEIKRQRKAWNTFSFYVGEDDSS